MWVAPEGRGGGVGRALVEAIAAWAVEAGATRLMLDVLPGNAPARGLYACAGFAAPAPDGPLGHHCPAETLTLSRPLSSRR